MYVRGSVGPKVPDVREPHTMKLRKAIQDVLNRLDRKWQRDEFIATMRDIARYLGREVTIDDLRIEASARGIACPQKNLWGNILRGREWRKIGIRRSSMTSAKGRMVGVYRHV